MPPWRRRSQVPDVLVSLAEGPPGRADLARRRAITLQAGSHTGGPGTRSGPLLAIAAGQAARNGLCRPPGSGLPLAIAVSAAKTHDGLALIPLVQVISASRSRRGPRRRAARLHGDKDCGHPHL